MHINTWKAYVSPCYCWFCYGWIIIFYLVFICLNFLIFHNAQIIVSAIIKGYFKMNHNTGVGRESWLGMEPVTLFFAGQHSIHRAIPARVSQISHISQVYSCIVTFFWVDKAIVIIITCMSFSIWTVNLLWPTTMYVINTCI